MGWLTYEQSLAQARRLAHHIGKFGVPVSIELQRGSGSGHWGHDRFRAPLNHHIVSRRSSGLTPGLRIIKNGRSDVPGPLANVYGGFDMVARIITMGLANHPGAGGPFTLPDGTVIPVDQGRYYLLGTEFEGGWIESDWTPDFRRFMGAVVAGKVDFINELRGGGVTDDFSAEHANWARPKGRKIDRLGYSRARGIDEARAARGGFTPSRPPAGDVRALQTMLTALGHYTGLIDGDAGPMTVAAVRAYQNTRPELAPDGWAGPLTLQHLTTDYQHLTGGDDMAAIIRRKGSHEHYTYDGMHIRYLDDPGELALLNALGAKVQDVDGAVIDRIPSVQDAVWTDRKVRRAGKDIDVVQDLADTGSIAREIRDRLEALDPS